MVPDEMRGKRVRCSYCGNVLLVPRKNATPLTAMQGSDNLVTSDSAPEAEDKEG